MGGLLIKQALINAHNIPNYAPIKDAHQRACRPVAQELWKITTREINDGNSDRSILSQAIVRNTEVTVGYDKRSAISDNRVSGENVIELGSR